MIASRAGIGMPAYGEQKRRGPGHAVKTILTIASDATQAKATHVGVRMMGVSVRLRDRVRVHRM